MIRPGGHHRLPTRVDLDLLCICDGVCVHVEGPRMIATPSLGMPNVAGMPTSPAILQQQAAAMPAAGAPFILAPHLQQMSGVTSHPSQACMLTGAGLMSMADTSPPNYMYSYDPGFVQRMFEYSASLEPSAVGEFH